MGKVRSNTVQGGSKIKSLILCGSGCGCGLGYIFSTPIDK